MNSNTHLPEAVAEAFVRAINRHDVDELIGLMSSGHCFVDGLGNRMVGMESLRTAWAAYFRMVPDYSVAIDETLVNGPVVVLLGMAQGTFSPDGQLRDENRWQTPIAVRAFVEDDLIAEWRIFADNEPIRKVIARCQELKV
jgi:ketosteroid isomerase-like protein